MLVESHSAENSYSCRPTEIAFLVLGRMLCSWAHLPAMGYADAKSKRGAHLRLQSHGNTISSRAPPEQHGASLVVIQLTESLPASRLRLPAPERHRKEPCGDSAVPGVAPAPVGSRRTCLRPGTRMLSAALST